MNEKDKAINRGQVYKRLTEYPEWEYFINELMEDAENLQCVINSPGEHEWEKGERTGLLNAVTKANDAIEEMMQFLEPGSDDA